MKLIQSLSVKLLNPHFLQIADSEFDAFVCSDELVCGAALFPPKTRLVVAYILFLLRQSSGRGSRGS